MAEEKIFGYVPDLLGPIEYGKLLKKLSVELAKFLGEAQDPALAKSITDVFDLLNARLDVLLSSRASEATALLILGQLNITLSALRDALRGAGTRDFTTLEADVEAVLARLDITTSALRDALRGAGTKDFTTLEADTEAISAQLNITLSALRDAIRGAGNKDFTTLEADIESILAKVITFPQKAGTNELLVEDTGVNTNPERYLQDNHWDCNEVTISVAGAGGQQNLGAAVGVGKKRRVRELTVRHAGTNNTVITLLVAGGATKLTFDVPPQTTRVWSSEDGRLFSAGEQPAVQSSDVTGGNTYVSAAGIEA